MTTTVLTEDFVSHTEEELETNVKIGGANTAASDWRLNVGITIRANSSVDSIVDAVKTTDPDHVVTETGTRETIRSVRDREDSTIEVEGSLGGGGYGLDGLFEMSVVSIDQTETTQHFKTVDGELMRRDYTEDLVIANNVAMTMSAGGNGFEFSFSSSSGNQFNQSKVGSLTHERVTGERRSGSHSSFAIYVDLNPNFVYHVSSRGGTSHSTEFDYTRYFDESGNVLAGKARLRVSTCKCKSLAFNSSSDRVVSIQIL